MPRSGGRPRIDTFLNRLMPAAASKRWALQLQAHSREPPILKKPRAKQAPSPEYTSKFPQSLLGPCTTKKVGPTVKLPPKLEVNWVDGRHWFPRHQSARIAALVRKDHQSPA